MVITVIIEIEAFAEAGGGWEFAFAISSWSCVLLLLPSVQGVLGDADLLITFFCVVCAVAVDAAEAFGYRLGRVARQHSVRSGQPVIKVLGRHKL